MPTALFCQRAIFLLQPPPGGVETVPQPVVGEVGGHDQPGDGAAWDQGEPPGQVDVLLSTMHGGFHDSRRCLAVVKSSCTK